MDNRGRVSSQDQQRGKAVLVWNSLRIKSARWAVRHITIYTTKDLKRWLGTHTQANERHANCIGLFAARAVQCPTLHEQGLIKSTRNTNPPIVVGNQGRQSIAFATPKEVCDLHLRDSGTSTSRRCDTTLRGQHKSDKEPLPLVLSSIILANMPPGQERHDMDRLAHPYRDTRGGGVGVQIRFASTLEVCTCF
jgi:hypothetical protein